MSRKSVVESAAILTFAGIITRILGFVYRIYMSNVIGAEGMGLYQLIMPVYSLAWSISCSGFTTTISKLTSQERARGEYGNMGRVLKQSLVITGLIGCLLTVLLYLGADYTAIYFIKDERITIALKILSLSFPFMAMGSCVRGYFFGLQEAVVPAVSQVFEQCVRMAVIFFLSSSFIPLGLSYACAAAVMGIVAGEILSFLYVIAKYKSFKNKHAYYKRPSLSSWSTLMLLMSMALPLTLNRVTGSLLATFENVLLPQKLQLFGMSATQAITEFGKVSGMAMPLIQFPSAVLISLSISLVPAISEAIAINNMDRINTTVSKSMQFTTVIGIGAAGLFILFADTLGLVIYNEDIGLLLVYLGIMCPFIYMQTTLSGVLNGLGEQVFIFRNSLVSSAISIGFILFAVPKLGMEGYIIGWFVSLLVVCLLNFERIKKITGMKIQLLQWFVKPLLSILASCLSINLLKATAYHIFGQGIGLILGALGSGFLYIIFIFLTGCLNKNDILSLFSKKHR